MNGKFKREGKWIVEWKLKDKCKCSKSGRLGSYNSEWLMIGLGKLKIREFFKRSSTNNRELQMKSEEYVKTKSDNRRRIVVYNSKTNKGKLKKDIESNKKKQRKLNKLLIKNSGKPRRLKKRLDLPEKMRRMKSG